MDCIYEATGRVDGSRYHFRCRNCAHERWGQYSDASYYHHPCLPGTVWQQPAAPRLRSRVWNLATALAEFAADVARHGAGGAIVDESEYRRRLAICQDCPAGLFRKDDGVCLHPTCGCYVGIKARGRAWHCPEGFWQRGDLPGPEGPSGPGPSTPGYPAAESPRPILFRFPHGWGDCVQFTVVLKHLQALRPELPIDVQAPDGLEGIFTGLCRRAWRLSETPVGDYALRTFVDWEPPAETYADVPSTKAERYLRTRLDIEPRVELCRYEIRPGPEAMAKARRYLEEICGSTIHHFADAAEPDNQKSKIQNQKCSFPAAIIHYQGRTARYNKDLPETPVRLLIERVTTLGLVPIVLDWTGASGLLGAPGVCNPGAGHWLWNGWSVVAAPVCAALIEQCSLMIGIDSGPGHTAGATSTPTIIVWTGHHPIHWYGLSPNVLHLLPEGHERLLRGAGTPTAYWETCREFFEKHYRHRVYTNLAVDLPDAVSAECERAGIKGPQLLLSPSPAAACPDRIIRQFPWRADGDLRFCPAHGVAYEVESPGDSRPLYDRAYWDKYVAYRGTEMARRLNEFRVALAARHAGRKAIVLDIGIGSGEFLEAWQAHGGTCYGYDVNPHAISWLRERRLWLDVFLPLPLGEGRGEGAPSISDVNAFCLWDVLEHLPNPAELLDLVQPGQCVLVSIPIFDPPVIASPDRLRRSKHYRPGEHFWYFTDRGLRDYFRRLGFACLESNDAETRLCRESIGSYAFYKLPPDSAALITGGLGDFLAIDAGLADDERGRIETVFYAARARQLIEDVIRASPAWHVKHHLPVWTNYGERFCFTAAEEIDPIHLPDGVRDLSIAKVFANYRHAGSSVLRSGFASQLTNEQAGGLPAAFAVICPSSPNDRRIAGRDFDADDWAAALEWLAQRGLAGVVLNAGDGLTSPAGDPRLIDLTNRTTIVESIALLQRAAAYVGIDSALSVLAAKLFPAERLAIKSLNPHLYAHRHVYYAPHTDFPFVGRSIREIVEYTQAAGAG